MYNHYLCNRQITVQYAFNTGDGNDMVARGGKDRGTYWKGMVVMPSACWQRPNFIDNFYGSRQDRENGHTKDARYNVYYLSYHRGIVVGGGAMSGAIPIKLPQSPLSTRIANGHAINAICYTNAPVTSAIGDITNMVLMFLLCRLIIGVDRTISFPLFCLSTASPTTRNAPPLPPPMPPQQTQGMPPPPPPPLPSEWSYYFRTQWSLSNGNISNGSLSPLCSGMIWCYLKYWSANKGRWKYGYGK